MLNSNQLIVNGQTLFRSPKRSEWVKASERAREEEIELIQLRERDKKIA
jgi:hypothetical protein